MQEGAEVGIAQFLSEIKDLQIFAPPGIEYKGYPFSADVHKVLPPVRILVQVLPYDIPPLLYVAVFPRSFRRSRRTEHGAGLVLVRYGPHDSAQSVGIHPVPPFLPFGAVYRSVPVSVHPGTFRDEKGKPPGNGIVSPDAEFGPVGPGIEMKGIHDIADTFERVVGNYVDILVPVRRTDQDEGAGLLFAYHPDYLYGIRLQGGPAVFHRFVENLVYHVRHTPVLPGNLAEKALRLFQTQLMGVPVHYHIYSIVYGCIHNVIQTFEGSIGVGGIVPVKFGSDCGTYHIAAPSGCQCFNCTGIVEAWPEVVPSYACSGKYHWISRFIDQTGTADGKPAVFRHRTAGCGRGAEPRVGKQGKEECK